MVILMKVQLLGDLLMLFPFVVYHCKIIYFSHMPDIDMLENVEIGEQKRRDDAYKAAKKKTGIYDDK
jgi:hypothetical protein